MLEWANVVMVVSELGGRHAHSVNQVYGDNDVIKNRFLKLTWHTQSLRIPGGFTKWQEKKCLSSLVEEPVKWTHDTTTCMKNIR